jgi:hypothetical protein
MADTTYTGANVAPSTDTFREWVDVTNRVAYSMSTTVLTAASVAQPNSTNHAETSGNGHVNGYFSSDTLIANTALRGGTTDTAGVLNISTNTAPSANLTLDLGSATMAWGNTYVNNLRAFGDVEASYTSDRRLKANVREIDGLWEIFDAINGYLFEWNTSDHRNGTPDIGVIAQEVETVLPYLVDEHPTSGHLSVKYNSLIPLLVSAIKDLKSQIDEIKEKI